MADNPYPGMLAQGNIDLTRRPIFTNPDGSISTVRSITATNDDGSAVLLPTVLAGQGVVPNDQAVRYFQQTGQNLGTFANEAVADQYAQRLHQQQAYLYDRNDPWLGHDGPVPPSYTPDQVAMSLALTPRRIAIGTPRVV